MAYWSSMILGLAYSLLNRNNLKNPNKTKQTLDKEKKIKGGGGEKKETETRNVLCAAALDL